MTIQTMPCPFCGNDDPTIEEVDLCCFAVCCEDCEAIGPIVRNNDAIEGQYQAIAKWNATRNVLDSATATEREARAPRSRR